MSKECQHKTKVSLMIKQWTRDKIGSEHDKRVKRKAKKVSMNERNCSSEEQTVDVDTCCLIWISIMVRSINDRCVLETVNEKSFHRYKIIEIFYSICSCRCKPNAIMIECRRTEKCRCMVKECRYRPKDCWWRPNVCRRRQVTWPMVTECRRRQK